MSFLTGPRTELVAEYIFHRQRKGRFFIPIGEQVLHLSDVVRAQSKALNEMIVLTIRKAPEMITEERKASFLALKIYNLVDYSYSKGCNQNGIPYGIVKLKQFLKDAYGYELEKQGRTQEELLDGIIEQMLPFKRKEFNAVIRHKKKLAKDVFGDVVTKQRGNMITIGQPILNYDVDLWQMSKIDEPINLPVSLHKNLIVPLSTQDQVEYTKLFNEKIECDYKQGRL